ncbi:hypothetical protein Asch01_00262 [Acinetobacter schindleri]
MKRISPALQAIFKYKITKYLVEDEVVINWGGAEKMYPHACTWLWYPSQLDALGYLCFTQS